MTNKGTKDLFRSATFENLSDTSIDSTDFKVVNRHKRKNVRHQQGVKPLNKQKAVSHTSCDTEVVNSNPQSKAEMGNESETDSSDSASNCNPFDLYKYTKETDYDTCASQTSQLEDPALTDDGSSCYLRLAMEKATLLSVDTGMVSSQHNNSTGENSRSEVEDTVGRIKITEGSSLLNILQRLEASISELRLEVAHGRTENTNGWQLLERMIDGVKADTTQVSNDLTTTNFKVQLCQEEIEMLKGTVIRQEQIIAECKAEIETLQVNQMRSNLIIKGIVQSEKENCKELVKNFFKEKLEITEEIKICSANRMGKGKKAPMFVKLMDDDDKPKIFSKVKLLADLKNEYQAAYSVDEQLPGRTREKRRRKRNLMAENRKKTVDKLIMSFEKGKLMVNNAEYVDSSIRVLPVKEILWPSTEDLTKRLVIEVHKG